MTTTITHPVSTGCCPPFDPDEWHDKEVTWQEKPFAVAHVSCAFHVPLNMGRTVRKEMAQIQAAHAETAERPLMLADERSMWRTDLLMEVAKEAPGLDVTRLSGTFLTRVFEGPYRKSPIWAGEMRDYVASKGRTLEQLYFGYTTCPRCVAAYGRNYVVLFARVSH